MNEFRPIEIDFEVYKRIQAERRNYGDTNNAALRRLLKIGGAGPNQPAPGGVRPANGARAWSGNGVTLGHGTELRMDYNGRRHSGVIENGEWVVEGKRFTSPSGAASGIATTKNGRHTRLDGWIYWYVKRPGDADWIAINELRPKTVLSIDDL